MYCYIYVLIFIFEGDKITYVYPDLITCLHGKFTGNGEMSAAQDAVIDRVRTEGGIMNLKLVYYASVECFRSFCESKYKRCHLCLLVCF